MGKYIAIKQGDLVTYNGPPILFPPKWELIVKNDNGIINFEDIGIIVKSDLFLCVADVYFDQIQTTIGRISFKYLTVI